MKNRNRHDFEVRRILSEYEAPYDQGAWERFDQKRNRKRRWVIWYRTAGIAASLLLLFVVTLMRDEVLPDLLQDNTRASKSTEEDTLRQIVKDIPYHDSLHIVESFPSQGLSSGNVENNGTAEISETIPRSIIGGYSSTSQNLTDTNGRGEDLPSELAIKEFPDVLVDLPPVEIPPLMVNEDSSSQSLENQDLIVQQNIEELESKTNKEKRQVVFGIALSSLLSSSPQASSLQPGVGGGVTAEIPFNNKFAFYTGLHLSDQKFINEINETPTIISSSKALQSISTNILSLDLPVNLRYNLSDKKNYGMYVTAGVSSLAYLAETTESEFLVPKTKVSTREYLNGGLIEVYETVQVPENEIIQSSSLEQFDLAGQLNLSFGYSYRLNNRLRFVVEPYYKHPLRRLSSSELSFKTAGVNLRLNFGRK